MLLLTLWPLVGFPVVGYLLNYSSELSAVSEVLGLIVLVQSLVVQVYCGYTRLGLLDILFSFEGVFRGLGSRVGEQGFLRVRVDSHANGADCVPLGLSLGCRREEAVEVLLRLALKTN